MRIYCKIPCAACVHCDSKVIWSCTLCASPVSDNKLSSNFLILSHPHSSPKKELKSMKLFFSARYFHVNLTSTVYCFCCRKKNSQTNNIFNELLLELRESLKALANLWPPPQWKSWWGGQVEANCETFAHLKGGKGDGNFLPSPPS